MDDVEFAHQQLLREAPDLWYKRATEALKRAQRAEAALRELVIAEADMVSWRGAEPKNKTLRTRMRRIEDRYELALEKARNVLKEVEEIEKAAKKTLAEGD